RRHARVPAPAFYRDLAAISTRRRVPPLQATKLRGSEAYRATEPEHDLVAAVGLKRDETPGIRLRQAEFRMPVPRSGMAEPGAEVVSQKATSRAPGKQRFYGAYFACPAGLRQSRERRRPRFEVGKR